MEFAGVVDVDDADPVEVEAGTPMTVTVVASPRTNRLDPVPQHDSSARPSVGQQKSLVGHETTIA